MHSRQIFFGNSSFSDTCNDVNILLEVKENQTSTKLLHLDAGAVNKLVCIIFAVEPKESSREEIEQRLLVAA